MDATPQKSVVKKAKKKAETLVDEMHDATEGALDAVEEGAHDAELALRERLASARDMVEDVRDMAERAFHERPYLLPVATGAVGLGVGILIGSRLARFAVVAGASALVSSTLRSEVGRLGRAVLRDVSKKLDEADAGASDEVRGGKEEEQPSAV